MAAIANAILSSSSVNADVYDVLMPPGEGSPITKPSTRLSNFVQYANAGGRVYASHYGYVWMFNNPPFRPPTVTFWKRHQHDVLIQRWASVVGPAMPST